ncbi:hypothetical protein JOF56_009869 [Kibdelosporangium banguiense]|uniref:Uncharacterized protein n=1 Tax=Kibdelosporangium banguiense TaxID=1365924 RepID=A0ABS4TZT5_9PSEU|nr:hypothetical protein [Kibdelosporangium banguiense]MBP2329484.1 hypothetical protein [Kibdelosporangium banguiense]
MDLIARHGHRLLSDYVFDPRTGLWCHRTATITAERIPDLRAITPGTPGPIITKRTSEPALATQLKEAERLLIGRPDVTDDGPTGLPPDFETLRWFVLPPGCLTG